MLDAAITNAIERSIQDKVKDLKAFTSFDIAKAAGQLSSLRFLHCDVKLDIHDAVARLAGSYLRKLISIPNVPDRMFLYFPPGTDPNGHRETDVIESDGQGRIRIPSRFVVGLHVQPQATIYVTPSAIRDADGNSVNGLKITYAVPAGATMSVEYLVDRRGEMIISRGVLIDAGIDGHCRYSIEGSASEITIFTA